MVLDPKTGKTHLGAPYEHFDAHWCTTLEATEISDFRFHDLRQNHGRDARCARGIALRDCRCVGHRTLAMVKRYSHLVIDHKVKVIEKMIMAKGL